MMLAVAANERERLQKQFGEPLDHNEANNGPQTDAPFLEIEYQRKPSLSMTTLNDDSMGQSKK